MIYREYGTTGKRISAISFGGMRFENPRDRETNAELILYAHEKGVNYFDTAPGYCADLSEDIFGLAFRQMPKDSFYAATKCGSPNGDDLRRALEKSLERFGLDCISFYHIWCLMSMEDFNHRREKGAIGAALKAREEGLIEHVVCSTHMNGRDTVELIGLDLFEGITIGFNAINFPYRQVGLAAAGDAEIGVVTMNPLAGGVIPQFPERFEFIKTSPSSDIVSSALRFNLSHPAVTSALVGFSNREQIVQAVMSTQDFTPLTGAEIHDLEQRIEEQFDGLCTGCGYCLPCADGVQIPRLMDAYNHRILYDDDQKMLNRMKYHWSMAPEAAEKCSACGACEERCTQHLPIIERLKDIARH